MRLIGTILWLRWRLAVHTLRGGKRKDALESFSRAASMVVVALAVLAVGPLALVLGGAAAYFGHEQAGASAPLPNLYEIARFLFLFALAAVAFGPLVRLSQGTANLSRWLLLPVSRRTFLVGELASWLVDPFVVLVVPTLVAFPAGLLAGGRLGLGSFAALLGAVLVVVLAALGTAVTLGAQILFRDRRRGEALTVVLVLALGLAGFLPSLQANKGREVHVTTPPWAEALPTSLYVRALRAGAAGETRDAAASTAGLAASCAVLLALAGAASRRLLDDPGTSGGRRGRSTRRRNELRIPGMAPAASALAWTQFRGLTRTVRGRIAVFFTPLTAALFGALFGRMGEAGTAVPAAGPLLFLATAFFAHLGLQPILANLYATDRAGLSLLWLSPLSDREVVAGKTAGCGIAYALALALSLVAIAITRPTGPPAAWLAVALLAAAAWLVLAPTAATLAALFPRTADLARLGTAGNPNQLAAVLLSLGTLAAIGLPAGIAIGASVLSGTAWSGAAVGGAYLAVAAAIHRPLLNLAAGALGKRRENLVLVAAGR